MKNDPLSKFIVVLLVVGVFLAMIAAAHSVASADATPAAAASAHDGAE